MSTQELDDLTQHGMTLRHGSCSLKIRDAPFVDQKNLAKVIFLLRFPNLRL